MTFVALDHSRNNKKKKTKLWGKKKQTDFSWLSQLYMVVLCCLTQSNSVWLFFFLFKQNLLQLKSIEQRKKQMRTTKTNNCTIWSYHFNNFFLFVFKSINIWTCGHESRKTTYFFFKWQCQMKVSYFSNFFFFFIFTHNF